MKKFLLRSFVLILSVFGATSLFAATWKLDSSKEITPSNLDGVTAILVDASGNSFWYAGNGGDGQDVSCNAVANWGSWTHSYVKFVAEGDNYFIQFVNENGEFYVPRNTWHDGSGILNITGGNNALFIGGKAGRNGQDGADKGLWTVSYEEGLGYTIYNVGGAKYVSPAGISDEKLYVKLYTELTEVDEATVFSSYMSNDKAAWAGATNGYGGGAERYVEGGLPEGEVLSQTIEGLPAGTYEIQFYAAANVARNLDVTVMAGDGLAYVFANDATQDITITTAAALGMDSWTNAIRTLTCTVGEDGVLKYGVANYTTAGQWYVTKVISLVRTGDAVLPSLGDIVWGVQMNDEGYGILEDDMVSLGVPVTFPDVVLPASVDPLSAVVTVSASLYGIPTNADIMPIAGEDDLLDGPGVDGPVAIAEAQIHNAYIDATGLHAYLFPEMLEAGNHYGIIIDAVTVMDGEAVVLEMGEDDFFQSPEIVVIPTVVPTLGDIVWGVEMNDEGQGIMEDDMVSLGVPVTFPDVVLPATLDPLAAVVTVSASLYGIPTNADIMPIAGEDDLLDGPGVDGPVAIAEAQIHNAYIDATGLHAYLFPEMLEAGNHYGIIIDAVTVMDGEAVVLEMGEDDFFQSPEIVVIPTVVPTLGDIVWGVEMNEDGTATLEEDMVNIGVPVSFPDVVLPANVDPLSAVVTISASLYGIPTNADIMPIAGEDDLLDGPGVDGPVAIAEAQIHNAYIDATGLHAFLFPEMLEAGNHYGIIIEAVTVMVGESVVLEMGEDDFFQSPEIVVTDPNADGINAVRVKALNNVMFNIAGQRVNSNAKGLVIMNGKKMIRK